MREDSSRRPVSPELALDSMTSEEPSLGVDTLEDYRQVYGLSTDPFGTDPYFPFFTGGQRRELLDQLVHLCQFGRGLTLLLGEPGIGKTRLALAVCEALGKSQACYVKALPTLDSGSLAREVAEHFALESKHSLAELGQTLAQRTDQQSPDDVSAILLDDASHLDDETLSQLSQMLLARDLDASGPQVVLVGDLRLFGRINRLDLGGLSITDLYLEAFTLSEATDYLNFRMEMADYLGTELFSELRVEPWWREAQGNLFRLHKDAQRHLLEAIVKPELAAKPRSFPVVHILAIAALASLVLTIWLYRSEKTDDGVFVEQRIPLQLQASSSVKSVALVEPPATQESTPEVIKEIEQSQASNPEDESPIEAVALSQASESSSSIATIQAAPTPVAVRQAPIAAQPVPARDATAQIPAPSVKRNQAPSSTAATVRALSVDEQTLLSWRESDYTLQLLGVSTEKAARDYVMVQANRDDLLMFKTKRQGKDWYVVVAGRYTDAVSARAAVSDLPASQVKEGPWPRDLGGIHRDIQL